ncbi:MAG: GNAT family N-acetyltransferase [Candidatus Paceibacterota bacterium]
MEITILKNKFVLKDKNKNIGYLKFQYPDDSSGKRNIGMNYIFIKPEYRRQGLAKKILAFALSYFKKNGIVWISFWTGKEIEQNKAYSLYEKVGFEEFAYQKDYYEKGVGVRLFVKRLNK